MSWLQSIKDKFHKGLTTSRHARALPCYQAIVAAARQPRFYESMNVPDTPQGRFEMLLVHAWLIIDRLAVTEPEFTQELFDLLFADFDRNLRELGVGDLGVGTRVKNWAAAFYGRAAAYKAALRDEGMLADALGRNIFAGMEGDTSKDARLLSFYVSTAHEVLLSQQPEAFIAGTIDWPK